MLAAHLQQADPIMYDIIEKVCTGPPGYETRDHPEIIMTGELTPGSGETQAKTLYQPDPVRELHLAGCLGRARESNAKYVVWITGVKGLGYRRRD
jgi:hypothetical protein